MDMNKYVFLSYVLFGDDFALRLKYLKKTAKKACSKSSGVLKIP